MNGIFKNKKRFIAILLSAIVLFALISAIFFIGAEAGHDCSGEDCLVCFQISNYNNILNSLGSVAFFAIAFLGILLFSAFLSGRIYELFINITLVSLNIKISD